MTVSELLAASRAAHQQYRASVPHKQSAPGNQVVVVGGSEDDARLYMQQAFDLRTQAESQDPDFADQAWQDELSLKYRHKDLLAWYTEQLGQTAVIRHRS